jgi:hypothetical protein
VNIGVVELIEEERKNDEESKSVVENEKEKRG